VLTHSHQNAKRIPETSGGWPSLADISYTEAAPAFLQLQSWAARTSPTWDFVQSDLGSKRKTGRTEASGAQPSKTAKVGAAIVVALQAQSRLGHPPSTT